MQDYVLLYPQHSKLTLVTTILLLIVMNISKSKLLKIIRESLNLKQSEVCDKLKISASYLSLMESGKKEIPGDMLQRLCELYNVPSYLFLWNEKDLQRTASEEEKTILENMNNYLENLFMLILKRNEKISR